MQVKDMLAKMIATLNGEIDNSQEAGVRMYACSTILKIIELRSSLTQKQLEQEV